MDFWSIMLLSAGIIAVAGFILGFLSDKKQITLVCNWIAVGILLLYCLSEVLPDIGFLFQNDRF